MMNSVTTLATHQLTVGYKKGTDLLPVLENISIEAQQGQLICFMGPNGVGKSTLLRTICGLQPALKGSIKLGDRDVASLNANDMARQISLVLTDRINAGNMSAYELVALGRYPYLGWNVKITPEDQAAIDKSIGQVGINTYVNKNIYELSDGQLQKVMIARCLAQNTPILILDEPTAHLDLNNRVAVMHLLRKLAHDANKTIIMATHELDLAFQSADRLWLAGGKDQLVEGIPEDLVLSGAIDEVFKFKGYDLKTGQMEKKSLGYKVALRGEGHTFLWTKNALERSGFDIEPNSQISVTVKDEGVKLKWLINNEGAEYDTLEALIIQLMKKF